MDSIIVLARERGISVIEDCAQAQGATVKPGGAKLVAVDLNYRQEAIQWNEVYKASSLSGGS